jgi:hypothetical protein
VGTVVLALVTLVAIVSTIIITKQDRRRADKRFEDERQSHNKEIADERDLANKRLAEQEKAAEARLKIQLEHSDEQLGQEREAADARLRDEREFARDREQWEEAYKIQVLQGERDGGPPTDSIYEETDGSLKVYGAIIINGSAYTITGVDARLRLADRSVVQFAGSERVTGARRLPDQLSDGMEGLLEALSHGDRLAPWDVGLRFYSDPMPLTVWFPIVRWTDRWGTRWEHRQGVVRKTEEGEDWVP